MYIQLAIYAWIVLFSDFDRWSADAQRMKLKNIVRHPCKVDDKRAPIVLPTAEQAVLMPESENDDGCYVVAGPILVRKHIKGAIQIFVDSKYGQATATARCKGADSNHCGGVGSCVYCNTCDKRSEPSSSSTSVRLQLIGDKIDCSSGIKPGNYTNLGLSFCLPTLDEYIQAQNLTRAKWDRLYKNRGQTIYQTFYIFNDQVNTLSEDKLRVAVATRRSMLGCDIVVADVTQ